MTKKSGNSNLRKANKAKNDEFYTQINDIENELKNYKHHFKDKIVFCNCDDPEYSNFFRYFVGNFKHLGLKKLITTHFHEQKQTYKIEVNSKNIDEITKYIKNLSLFENGEVFKHFGEKLSGNGDFRSNESIEILKISDIVVTNPPFSLFREYIAQLYEYDKKFLVLGNMNAITYKEIFPLIKENKLWSGYGFNMSLVFESIYENTLEANVNFCKQKGYFGKNYIKTPAINWYTNLEHNKRNEKMILYKTYLGNEEYYPKYDNYDAINIDKVAEIPLDYKGAMGVPITFIDKYNPEQFEIIKFRKGNDEKDLVVNGKSPYFRILIKPK
ncbi:hypothetical protein H3C61_02570 [Candidatus Gracilibacteria bacterium]|nr:hypothetical protein [Candidatus Gracilibacteria bacterium]